MADKIPVKANFTGADVTSLGEFAAGDTVPVANGGTGATTAADARTNLGAAALGGSASQSFSMLNGTVAGTLGVTGLTTLNGRTTLQAASEPYALGVKYSAAGGHVYFGATDSTPTPGWQISNASGAIAISGTYAGAVTIPGTLSLTGAASTLGYGTGAGGTVTQATNKSTAVTLNKPCGLITMHNASLASGASVTFALNNSLLLATDLLVVNGRWIDVDPIAYRVEVARTTSGGFATIRITNITAGALAQAIELSFAIIKGATV